MSVLQYVMARIFRVYEEPKPENVLDDGELHLCVMSNCGGRSVEMAPR